MNTPLLFIIFNRPEPTRIVFEEIRKAKPKKLFVAADGPRLDRPEDVEKCRLTREIIKNIDWPCEVKTLFQEQNLGCKVGATTGITWFFDNVEEGIILEDDCLPDQSFFRFCEEMLEKYRNEPKVVMISGYNIAGVYDSKFSYIFSKYGGLWGWATWKRSWKQYDITMNLWRSKKNQKIIKKAIGDRNEWNYKQRLYEQTFNGQKDTWDYQWETYRLLHGQLSVLPTKNLIENLGFGADATHTIAIESPLLIKRNELYFPLTYNTDPLEANKKYDMLLRPKIKVSNIIMSKIKNKIIDSIKNVTPPLLYESVKKIILRKKYNPKWNVIKYKPLDGVRIFFDSSGNWQNKMMIGTYDSFLFDTIKSMPHKGKVIYDIGAHIGFHSFNFARLVGKEGKVYSFEPNVKNFERFNLILDENKDLKNITKVYNVAISDKIDTVEFNINTDVESGRSTGSFLENADPFWSKDSYKNRGFIKTEVKSITLDSFEKELNIPDKPDIIKIDVEGAEYLVLKGAEQTLLSKKPILFIEVHSILNMYKVITFLNDLGYSTKVLNQEPTGICYIEATPNKIGKSQHNQLNY